MYLFSNQPDLSRLSRRMLEISTRRGRVDEPVPPTSARHLHRARKITLTLLLFSTLLSGANALKWGGADASVIEA